MRKHAPHTHTHTHTHADTNTHTHMLIGACIAFQHLIFLLLEEKPGNLQSHTSMNQFIRPEDMFIQRNMMLIQCSSKASKLVVKLVPVLTIHVNTH
jgi:hypothetical protein